MFPKKTFLWQRKFLHVCMAEDEKKERRETDMGTKMKENWGKGREMKKISEEEK